MFADTISLIISGSSIKWTILMAFLLVGCYRFEYIMYLHYALKITVIPQYKDRLIVFSMIGAETRKSTVEAERGKSILNSSSGSEVRSFSTSYFLSSMRISFWDVLGDVFPYLNVHVQHRSGFPSRDFQRSFQVGKKSFNKVFSFLDPDRLQKVRTSCGNLFFLFLFPQSTNNSIKSISVSFLQVDR